MHMHFGLLGTLLFAMELGGARATRVRVVGRQTNPGDNANANATALPKNFTIKNLQAQALVLSHRVAYDFDVTFAQNANAVHCGFLGTDDALAEAFTNVTDVQCGGSASGVTFSWTQVPTGGAVLGVFYQLAGPAAGAGQTTLLAASRKIHSNETIEEGAGVFRHQIYVGPANFSMPTASVGPQCASNHEWYRDGACGGNEGLAKGRRSAMLARRNRLARRRHLY